MTALPPEIGEIVEGIRTMRIRGAGKIARSAAKCMMITAQVSSQEDSEALMEELDGVAKALLATRPTAVSLPNSIKFIMKRVRAEREKGVGVEELKWTTVNAATEFIENSVTAIKRIGEIGSRRIQDGDRILTHCNSTAAISVIITAWEKGKRFGVYVTESRPRYQGRLTARALQKYDIPVTMIIDSAVRHFMGKLDKFIVGADAVAANGAVVNKIGTSTIALVAHEARVLTFVAAETYKFSPETMIGELVTIEERPKTEILPETVLNKLRNVEVRNPAFDVTPAEYIDLIITEKGIIPPEAAIIVLRDEFGRYEEAPQI